MIPQQPLKTVEPKRQSRGRAYFEWGCTFLAALLILAAISVAVFGLDEVKAVLDRLSHLLPMIAIGMAMYDPNQHRINDTMSFRIVKPGISRRLRLIMASLFILAGCCCLAAGAFLTFPYWRNWIGG